ncbi:hypothetical protein LOTGIDRAFT_214741 [Lottia gigantea]|uniref:Flavin-containing monooxygenase n=1 Tax=Lottia gigantea TaxID=225164 RepID=V4C3R5_LOTGI|nr:hypothetical protein LOTGIDRAFT_214741 [Lottia gigantea]ESO96189.1 hypothetical protein LOTGIDRAFT_214741 [Lottia gigantea]
MSSGKKRIAVIGSGASGLTAIKCCLDEGLEPVCFEVADNIGGLWRFNTNIKDGLGCVMKSTVINTSKEMMCYSDFPIPKEYPIFMHNRDVFAYFNQYADAFDLKKYIKFQTEVISVKKSDDFEKTGRWDVSYKDVNTGSTDIDVFDGVLICTGHHATKNEPKFSGLEEFKGKVLHTHDYRDFHGFEEKKVVIVGIGNSGGDAAVELSRICKQVYLSTRRGSWVINRIVDNGMPADMAISSRLAAKIFNTLPKSVVDSLFAKHLNKRFDHVAYSLKPDYGATSQHPMVNDELPNRIISGSIKIKTDIKRFTERGVEFLDGTIEDDIDIVVLATGYIFGFPFVEKSVIDVKDNRVELYKYMFPPELSHHTLAVIGCIQPLGAVMPISEMQCRLATRVFKGDVKLPSKGDMWEDIRNKQVAMMRRYVKSLRHTIQVDYAPFMDELAELNGNSVQLMELMKTDPKLGLTCFFGPCTPYQYRLFGPGKWDKARECIMTQWDRTLFPLKTRSIPPAKKSNTFFYIKLAFIFLFLAFILNQLDLL